MRRFTSMFITKRDKTSDLSSSSSSTNSDHIQSPSWKYWIGAKRKPITAQTLHVDEDSQPGDDEDEDEDEEEEEEEDHHHRNDNIRIHIQNALVVNPQPNSPFLHHHPHQPMFPRSSNNTNLLAPQSSTRKFMFNTHLLARLNSATLSPSELSSILPFASKPTTTPITHPILPSSDISHPKKSSHISSASLGIHRWITRPCFENRVTVYLPTHSGIQSRPVTSSMPIAALEYPEYLDVMVDPDFDQSSPTPEKILINHSHADLSHTVSAIPSLPEAALTPVHWRNSSTPVPSPLRIQHSPPPPLPTTSSSKEDMLVTITPAQKSTVKRVVRFAEDDEDDGIPLHIVRMKKKREEKAKFLLMEQLKRTKEEEEEQTLKEQEALERERRRLAKEKEKRETDKALYAETIVATRMRREGHRAGTILPSNTTSSSKPLLPSSSFTSLRNSERNKPLTDPRKLSSNPPFNLPPTLSIPRRDNSDPAYYHPHSDSSPGSSRSPSIGHSPVSPNHPSRSPSMYSAHTSSSEEVRQQRGSRRNSITPAAVASVSSGRSSYHRPPLVSSYPSWSGSSQTIPHVPPLPDFVHDMPLLPPTAPFMKGSLYNRRSKSPGPSSSSRRGSFNSSNECVNQLLPPQTTHTSTSPRHHSSTTVPSSHRKAEKRPTHERGSSGDSRTPSLHATQHQQRPTPTPSWSQPAPSRGRPALPSQYLQTPSPWSALPSQHGLMPTPMSMSMPMGYSPMNVYPVLLYPTGPMPTMQGLQVGSGGGGGREGGGGGLSGNNNGWREPLIS